MKRRREQRGTVYAKSGMWYVRYTDFRVTDGQLERKRLAKQLGSVDDISKKEARLEAKVFLARINQPTLTPETAVTFTAFVESVYLPHSEQRTRRRIAVTKCYGGRSSHSVRGSGRATFGPATCRRS
jgi:hypothetical protein